MWNPFRLKKNITVYRSYPKSVSRDGRLGGICLDFFDKIPKEYKDFLYIGKNVFIKSGTIICGEGFRFDRKEDGTLEFIKHKHGLQIHDNVWIGSNCTIDRGRKHDTVVGGGVKIDNGVHIAHNVIIEENCIIGTGVRLLGSCHIGKGSEIWSDAVIHQGVKIGNNCVVGANTYLRKDLPDNHLAYMEGKRLVIKPLHQSKQYRDSIYKTKK